VNSANCSITPSPTSLDADGLLAGYCALLYENTGNYEAVARKTKLDARTAKKYAQQGLKA